MVFPDDEREANPTSFKFLQMAHQWKAMQAQAQAGDARPTVLSGFAAASTTNGKPADEDKNDDENDEASSGSEDDA